MHKKLKKLDLDKVMIGFDATSLYPRAMWDQNKVYSKIETFLHFNLI